ncbi:unnamed protein product, partial [Ectocarpus sp. 12 AP-2014]
RTRCPAAIATALTAGGGGSGDRGGSEDRPWTGGEGTGTFSDFAKSLRDLQQTGELDLSSEGAAGKSGRGSSDSPRPNLRPPPPERPPPQHHRDDDDEGSGPLDLSGSLVVGEADMESRRRLLRPPFGGRITDSPVTSSGLWDVPTAAPSLAELEYQLRKLSPLRGMAAGASKARGAGGAGRGSRSPALKSRRGGARGGGGSGGGSGTRSRRSEQRGGGFEGGSGSGVSSKTGRSQLRHREGSRREGVGRGGEMGGAGHGEAEQSPADLSSVVLVSSLSSTPGRRKSGSGRWATGQEQRGVTQTRMGGVDLGVDDLSAAHWELTEAERDLQRREREVDRRERIAAEAEEAASQTQREAARVREKAERELEKAKAEIYALQVSE